MLVEKFLFLTDPCKMSCSFSVNEALWGDARQPVLFSTAPLVIGDIDTWNNREFTMQLALIE